MPKACRSCGTDNRDDANFCSSCGIGLMAVVQAAAAKPAPKAAPTPPPPPSAAPAPAPQPDAAAPAASGAAKPGPVPAVAASRRIAVWVGLWTVMLAAAALVGWWVVGRLTVPNIPVEAVLPPELPTANPASGAAGRVGQAAVAAATPAPAPARAAPPASRHPPAAQTTKDRTTRDKARRETKAAPAAPRPQSARELCAGRSTLGGAICEARECSRAAHAGEALCRQIRAAEERRREGLR